MVINRLAKWYGGEGSMSGCVVCDCEEASPAAQFVIKLIQVANKTTVRFWLSVLPSMILTV